MMGKLGQMMGLGGGMPMPTPEQIDLLKASRKKRIAAGGGSASKRSTAC